MLHDWWNYFVGKSVKESDMDRAINKMHGSRSVWLAKFMNVKIIYLWDRSTNKKFQNNSGLEKSEKIHKSWIYALS